MNLSWWADVVGLISFTLSIPAYWALLSERGREIMSSKKWISPLLVTIAIIIAALQFAFLSGFIDKWTASESYRPTSITGRTFRNEQVPLDNHAYTDCTFVNVTFAYNGSSPAQLTNNKIGGSVMFTTENPAVFNTLAVLKGLGFLKPGINIFLPSGSPDPSVEDPIRR